MVSRFYYAFFWHNMYKKSAQKSTKQIYKSSDYGLIIFEILLAITFLYILITKRRLNTQVS